MKRWLFLVYGIGGYVAFLATYAYMAGFVGNAIAPRTIDSPVGGQTAQSVAINLLLMAIFAVQHSVMARPAFKRLWTRLIPQPIERATYVWASNAASILLMWQWRPIGALVWDTKQPIVRGLLWSLFAVGWLAVPLITLLISHFDLFGTRQVWLFWRKKPYTNLPFRTPAVYAHVRHPLYLGWGLAFWAIPTMSVGHLLFASFLTGYMILATILEERDLVAHFGEQYRQYQENVGRFVPRFARAALVGRRRSGDVASAVSTAPTEETPFEPASSLAQ